MYAYFNFIQLLDMMSYKDATFTVLAVGILLSAALHKTSRIKLPSIQFFSITYVQAAGNNGKKWVKKEQGSPIHSNQE
jgi:hypothetical protein